MFLYVVHNCQIQHADGKSTSTSESTSELAQASCWIMYSLVSHCVRHSLDTSLCNTTNTENVNSNDNSTLILKLRLYVTNAMHAVLNDTRNAMKQEWETRMHFLVVAYVKVHELELPVLFNTTNKLLLSQEPAKQYTGS